ncbi:sporulation phosphorelay system protein KapB [Ornithinibacillus sp. 4-3]|uniref:Sporulation phosphorelay system protein KapB n=1 Tax=Ornithinibacillus sp. 4-3 TaxID=3231488 RepID=A0AB39HIM2_9BACI
MAELEVGKYVLASYNSGAYIGKLLEDRRNFQLVEVLAVVKHPNQGDLHNPGQVENVAFFERKALGFKEKMNVQRRKVQAFDGEIPDYHDSLKQALQQLKDELSQEDTAFNKKSLEKLADLEAHYYHK